MSPLAFAVLLLIQLICAQEKCKLQNDAEGICVEIKKCPSAIDEIKLNKTPITCGFEGSSPIVCCEAYQQSKSRRECSKFPMVEPPSKIIGGGVNALPCEFPHMAAIGYESDQKLVWACGGTLISEKFVLTAAHCLYSRDLKYPTQVRLGDLNLKETTDDADPQDFTILRAIPHPSYKPPSKYNDIGLLELNVSAKFTECVNPACLQVEEEPDNLRWQVAGWGLLGYNGEPADHLQKLKVKEFTGEECNEFYAPNRKLLKGIVETQVCAAGPNKSDTCQGDSGGPLHVRDYKSSKFNVIGVTSFGKVCTVTRAPGVYTRVSKYVDWIESIVWP